MRSFLARAAIIFVLSMALASGALLPVARARAQQAKPGQDDGEAKPAMVEPPPEPPGPVVTVYRNHSYGRTLRGRPIMAKWTVRRYQEGTYLYLLLYAGIMYDLAYAQRLELPPPDLAAWREMLAKGQRWAKVAHAEEAEVVKPMGQVGGVKFTFFSYEKGLEAEVVVQNPAWEYEGPLYLRIPEASNSEAQQTIGEFLANLETADEQLKAKVAREQKLQGLFK